MSLKARSTAPELPQYNYRIYMPPICAMAYRPYRLGRQPYHYLPAPSLQHIFAMVARCLSLFDRITAYFLYRGGRHGLHHFDSVVPAFLIHDDQHLPSQKAVTVLFLASFFGPPPTSDRAELTQVSITWIPYAHLRQGAAHAWARNLCLHLCHRIRKS
jgi:hypothetical protein